MKRIGLVDIGSNTIRLVIFEYSERAGLIELQNIKTPARLYQYLDADKVMAEEGIEVLCETLDSFQKVADKFEVSALYPVATAAVRQSQNITDIIDKVESRTGITMRIISEKEEAYFGFYAVVNTLDYEDGVTVDIGGGSTEVTYYEDKELKFSHSFPFGVVTLQKLFFNDKAHNNPDAIEAARAFVREKLQTLKWLGMRRVPIIAIGGSARNFARIHQNLSEYPIAGVHGYSMTKADLEYVFRTLINSSMDQLEDLDGLSKDRQDIIVPSGIVFTALYEEVMATEFIFSRKGLREGITMSILEEDYKHPFDKNEVFNESLRNLAHNYNIHHEDAMQRQKLADLLYFELEKLGLIEGNKHQKKLMLQAAYLFYLGSYIDSDASSQHTYYIISNSSLNGVGHRERVKLALLASYKSKSLLKFFMDETKWFSDKERAEIQMLGSILKFAHALNVSNTQVVNSLYFDQQKDHYDLVINYTGDPIAEEYQADRQKKHLEKITKSKIHIIFRENLH
ncbi:Ppx/GppA family phosphatase [Macrococcus carouselicus]|uniref:Ppx/GppA family phosphatase n=1 Tax=Macrococcus carouselicus TaxID=69969 RepID=A0A9Q8FSV7_9STAP|nr:Ppx/GppA family phosphatase [Macrococcus carouselicus]TDM04669.1 Ppx/GppA family phosphatase [Macrococcus carouselicus]